MYCDCDTRTPPLDNFFHLLKLKLAFRFSLWKLKQRSEGAQKELRSVGCKMI